MKIPAIELHADLGISGSGVRRYISLRQLLRLRFQLLGVLLLAAALPAFARGNFSLSGMVAGNNLPTMFGATVAILAGYILHKRLSSFPGVLSSSYVVPSFAASFGAVIMFFFFFRLDYTRSTFGAGFVIAVGWAYAMNALWMRVRQTRLALAPFGAVEDLPAVTEFSWCRLDSGSSQLRNCDGLVVDLRAKLTDEWERYIADAALSGIPVYHVKQIRESLTGRVEIEHLSENTLGSINPNQIYLKLKQMADWQGALLALLLLWPLFVAVYVAIRLDSPGPAVFRQLRKGYRGQDFHIFKFRTMRQEPPADSEAAASERKAGSNDAADRRSCAQTADGDPRITRVGRFLRKTRLDELPQIVNILRGEMSWIGPRPEALVLSDWYEAELPFYRYRHIVRPGISGWAQVNQGHVAEVDQVLGKLHYDFYYIKNFSLWLDLLIVLKTVRTVLSGAGAR